MTYMRIKRNKSFRLIFYIALVFIMIASGAYRAAAQRTATSQRAGELRKAEKGLGDNKYYFYFLNSSVTNFGGEGEKKVFKEAFQRDIISQLLFLKYLFRESYIEIRKAQKLLIDLYRTALTRDINSAKSLLNEIAPGAVESKRAASVHYLELGYRDMRVAEIYMMMADNYTPSLYSMRLYKYVEAIKLSKHGRRYALLALIESRIDPEEKMQFENPDFDQIKEKISRYAPAERQYHYNIIHLDNYYLPKDGKSYYDVLWDKPDLKEIPDYQKYLDEIEMNRPQDGQEK
jgi:hypothetical protein